MTKDSDVPWLKGLTEVWKNVNAQTIQTAYVANNIEACSNFTPCYTNSEGVDGPNGLGTGLRLAVTNLNPGDEIVILGNYAIKDQTVLIDKNLAIRGYENSLLTYTGQDCSMPMLRITAGGSLQDLRINGGSCAEASRNLITINTTQDLKIEHNTLQNGNRAIDIIPSDGVVTVAFNQITDNQDYAIYQQTGSGNGTLEIYANNIFSNRTGIQVNCSSNGSADHNFWGEGILPATAVQNCETSDSKRLGAPITTLPNTTGVQAIRQTVTENFNYAFENNIGVKRNSGSAYDLIIVNHGQGTEENIPFLESGATPIVACSNFYDVFTAKGAIASDLALSIKYDLNDSCLTKIESSDFCGQNDSSQYPLWWYDPSSNLTDGWDRTGEIPGGDNPLNVEGQTTTCNVTENEIQVIIDNSGRPGITQDLNFTPFLAGLPIGTCNITAFEVSFDVDQVDVYWETALESRILGYYVLRANSEMGPYYKISNFIPSNGSNSLYEFTDALASAEFNKNYYYKVEIINSFGDSLRTHGPVSILTSTPTPSLTPTRTLYPTRTPYPTSTSGPTRTATQYIYRSPTPIYRPFTSTPYGTPTQVRTDRPSPTGPSPTNNQTEISLQTGTPGSESLTRTTQNEMTVTVSTFEPTEISIRSRTPGPENTNTVKTEVTSASQEEQKPPNEYQYNWLFILTGAGLGLGMISIVSFYLSKSMIK